MADSLTEEQQQRRRQAVRDLMPTTPCMGWLGIVLDRYEPDDGTDFHGRDRSVTMSIQYVGAAKRSDLICHGRTARRRAAAATRLRRRPRGSEIHGPRGGAALPIPMRARPRELHSGTADPA
jgi:hypothetical protein